MIKSKALLKAAVVTVTMVTAVTMAQADEGRYGDRHGAKLHLSKSPKTIVIDNLDTAMFEQGDEEVAEHVCGECHSVDYVTTQPKLSCAVWAKEIVKMGNTFNAYEHWEEESVGYSMLNEVLVYLADNYGDADGSSTCDMNAVRAVPGLEE